MEIQSNKLKDIKTLIILGTFAAIVCTFIIYISSSIFQSFLEETNIVRDIFNELLQNFFVFNAAVLLTIYLALFSSGHNVKILLSLSFILTFLGFIKDFYNYLYIFYITIRYDVIRPFNFYYNLFVFGFQLILFIPVLIGSFVNFKQKAFKIIYFLFLGITSFFSTVSLIMVVIEFLTNPNTAINDSIPLIFDYIYYIVYILQPVFSIMANVGMFIFVKDFLPADRNSVLITGSKVPDQEIQ